MIFNSVKTLINTVRRVNVNFDVPQDVSEFINGNLKTKEELKHAYVVTLSAFYNQVYKKLLPHEKRMFLLYFFSNNHFITHEIYYCTRFFFLSYKELEKNLNYRNSWQLTDITNYINAYEISTEPISLSGKSYMDERNQYDCLLVDGIKGNDYDLLLYISDIQKDKYDIYTRKEILKYFNNIGLNLNEWFNENVMKGRELIVNETQKKYEMNLKSDIKNSIHVFKKAPKEEILKVAKSLLSIKNMSELEKDGAMECKTVEQTIYKDAVVFFLYKSLLTYKYLAEEKKDVDYGIITVDKKANIFQKEVKRLLTEGKIPKHIADIHLSNISTIREKTRHTKNYKNVPGLLQQTTDMLTAIKQNIPELITLLKQNPMFADIINTIEKEMENVKLIKYKNSTNINNDLLVNSSR